MIPDKDLNKPDPWEVAAAAAKQSTVVVVEFPTVKPVTPPTVQQSAKDYTDLGWQLCQIRGGTKEAVGMGWNEPGRGILSSDQLPADAAGVGLLHVPSHTCSVDVDNKPIALEVMAEKGIDLQALLDADDAVQIVSGKAHKAKLIYRVPNGMRLPSKQIKRGGKVVLEFRHGTTGGINSVQDILPPSIHPDTMQPYRWGGKGHFSALPALPEAILKMWEGMIEEDSRPRVVVEGEHNTSIDEITSALYAIPPDCTRGEWIDCGMALKLALGDEGLRLWDEWSKGDPKQYPGEAEMQVQWASFKNDKPVLVTVGSLLHHAQAHGWVRPQPDVSKLFAEVKTAQAVPGFGAMPEGKDLLATVMAKLTPSKPPPLNLDILPYPMAAYAREVATSIGCDTTVTALAGMATLCGVIDARSRVRASATWTEPPVLWFVAHGESADKKTAGAKPMAKVTYTLEKEDMQRYETELLIWQGKEARHAAEMKTYKEWQKSSEAAFPGAVPPMVTPLPSPPQPKLLVMMDVSSQEAVRMAMVRPYGMTLVKDEMADWLQRVTDPKSGENRSAWTQANEGNNYRLNRTGSGAGAEFKNTDCLAISIYGNAQPVVWAEASPKLVKDGMRGRFIVAMLDTERTQASGQDVPEFMSAKGIYEQMIRRAHAAAVQEFTLSPEAKALHRAWEIEIVEHAKELKRRGYGEGMQQIVAKLGGTPLRVALTFHLAESPHEGVIASGVMERAIAFARDFVLEHAIAVEGLGSSAMKLDRWVVERVVKESAAGKITLSEMRRVVERWPEFAGRRADVVEAAIVASIGIVEHLGWVVRGKNNGLTTQWLIDPSLVQLFASERERLLAERKEFTLSLSTKARGGK